MATRRSDLWLGALAIASLGANVVLISLSRASAVPPATSAPAATATPAPGSPPLPSRALAEAWRQPFAPTPASDGNRPGSPVTLDPCALAALRLAAQLTDVEGLRAQHLPPPQRFASAAPNPELTGALLAELGHHLPAAGLEARAGCRDRLCRVAVTARDSAWLARFRESAWVGENLRELAPAGDALYFQQQAAGTVRGSDLLQQALQDFEASGAIEECQARFRREGEGTLDAHVSIASAEEASEEAPAGINVRAGGRLAGTPLGQCIDAAFRRALTAIELPSQYDGAVVLAQYPKP